MARKRKSAAPPAFAQGARVRVRVGTSDPDYPDMPLGGWAGTVAKIQFLEPPLYLVRWNRQTLAGLPLVFRSRRERDGLDHESMWLAESDLEPDDGGPVRMEQPPKVVPRALSMKDQDDRVRAVFGRTSDEPLPDVTQHTLRVYCRHLTEKLTFPFEARWTAETEPFSARTRRVTVTGLAGGDDDPWWIDDSYGILCEARLEDRSVVVPLAELELRKGDANRPYVKDYSDWLANYA